MALFYRSKFLYNFEISSHNKIMSDQLPAIKNIFLADDNNNDCLAFEKAIIRIDVHIKLTTVTNGEELLQLLNHYIPELLFLDLEMPFKNGIQCLQII